MMAIDISACNLLEPVIAAFYFERNRQTSYFSSEASSDAVFALALRDPSPPAARAPYSVLEIFLLHAAPGAR
jgi:hypothetical protein